MTFYVTTPRDPTCHRIFLVGLRYNRFDSMEHLEPFLCCFFYVFIFPFYNFQCTFFISLHVFNIISNPYDSVNMLSNVTFYKSFAVLRRYVNDRMGY